MPGLLAEKLGMTQIFSETGAWLPVTVVRAGPCAVVTKKTREKDGYGAIQLGFTEIDAKRRSKPYAGHFTKKNLKVYKVLREMRTDHSDAYVPGDFLTAGLFAIGDVIDVTGTSKGKGFQGVMKRHHFKGGRATHGCSVSHRSAGSIGQRTYPGKVFKGKRMAGRMGGETVTVKNLKVVGIEPGDNLLLIEGAVPGPNRSIVVLRAQGEFEKKYLASKTKKEEKTEDVKA
ncbi:MAG: 50S ribosomal protein L3 [Deltaproteobacteria bacterium]|nr:50S ribosomal protein L3 [Deltaproteobacteria bacterium]